MSESNPFQIKTASYEGPFELVLELIESHKLHISELALARITDEFIAHVRNQQSFPVEMTADFISVAATLLLIKSKALLPTLELSEGEEEDVRNFEDRLRMYEASREASRELSKIFGNTILVAPLIRDDFPIFSPSQDFTKEALLFALDRVLAQVVEAEPLIEARVRSTVTIEQMMDTLLERVQTAMTLSFRSFSEGAKDRTDIIVSFLALLELVKDGKLEATQEVGAEDIVITTGISETPRYGV